MKLKVKANDGSHKWDIHDAWELHDDHGFLCAMENERSARYIAHCVNMHDRILVMLNKLRRSVTNNPVARKLLRDTISQASNQHNGPKEVC